VSEADRIVKQKIAAERAAKEEEYQRRGREDALQRENIHREIDDFVAKIVRFAKEHNYPGVEPIKLRKYRFPPFGDAFGYHESVKGGWSLGSYGMQSLGLLPDGRILWEGMPSQLSKIKHCVPLVRNGLRELWEHLNADDDRESWRPPSVTIGP
jgi:hypothetical protein